MAQADSVRRRTVTSIPELNDQVTEAAGSTTSTMAVAGVSNVASAARNNKEHNTVNQKVKASIVASCVGSTIASLSVHPLEVVKVRIQNSLCTTAPAAASDSFAHPSQHPRVSPASPTLPTTTNVRSLSSYYRIPLSPPGGGCSSTGGAFSVWPTTSSASCTTSQQQFVIQNYHPRACSGLASSSIPAATSTTATRAIKTNGMNEIRQTIAMIRQIASQEGVAGFYNGLRPSLVMVVPNAMVYYTMYDWMAAHMRQWQQLSSNTLSNNTFNSWVIPLVGGSTARLVATTVTAPLEYLRTVQAANVVSNSHNRTTSPSRSHHLHRGRRSLVAIASTGTGAGGTGVLEPLRHIWQNEGGFRALFRGLGPLLWRDLPFSAIYWLCLEQLRELQPIHPSSSTPSSPALAIRNFGHGAVAGIVASIATAPADVVKTRYQARTAAAGFAAVTTLGRGRTASAGATTSTSTKPTITPIGILRDIVAHQGGLTRLWRGSLARTSKVALSCAIMIASYECGKRTMLQLE